MGKKRKWFGMLLLIVCVLAFAGCGQTKESQEEPPEEVLHPQDDGDGGSTGADAENSPEDAQKTAGQGSNGDMLKGAVGVKIGLDDDTQYMVDMYGNKQVQTMLGYLSDSEIQFPTYTYDAEEGYAAQDIRGNYSRDDEETVSDIHAGELYLFSDGQLRLYFKDVPGADIKATPVGRFVDCEDITKKVEDAYEANRDDSWGVEVYFLLTKNVSGTEEKETAADTARNTKENQIQITAGDSVFTATLADNSSAEALKELLADGPLTIDMSDYGDMEKVGPIGKSLPTNDEEITTEAGDLILYQGNSLVIYYDTNSWNFTRLGKIEDVTGKELLKAFGEGNVTVTFSL